MYNEHSLFEYNVGHSVEWNMTAVDNLRLHAAVILVLLVVVGLSVATWFLAPKGDNQTVWRSSIILTLAMCYLMWAITYLSQLHPLIQPMRSDLRPEFAEGY
ncbi:ATP synthase subunit H-domain-containing protein [Lipomyces kononenkoae]